MPSDYASITRDNIRRRGEEFDDIGRLVSEQLYSDRTHFIYELLQNAEDALARRVRTNPEHTFPRTVAFSLTQETLGVKHYGEPFITDDVRGISDVLRGTKAGDAGQIGRFGIGFKSVYAFTDSPRIHSGDEHFQIERYIRVHSVSPQILETGETRFIFPLRHPSLSPQKSFDLISAKLKFLGPRVLLFLRHIDSIDWTIKGGDNGRYRREQGSQGPAQRVTIINESQGRKSSENWILFSRDIDDKGHNCTHTISLAYLLECDERSGREQVKPITSATLAVYFPTERETHLGFLINGPYLTTPARDNILSDPFNAWLIRETGTLVVESLEHLKAMGLLTASALQALPINVSNFAEGRLFRPIFDAVQQALRTRELLPAYQGGFIAANRAKLARSSELRDLLLDKQLTQLFQTGASFRWLSDEITFDRTPELRAYLLQQLEIQEVTPEVFAGQLEHAFLQAQSDQWLTRLYGFLDAQPALWRAARPNFKAGILRTKPIIREESGAQVVPFNPDGQPAVFLPPFTTSKLPLVKRSIAADPQALEFLRRLPLTLPDLANEVLTHVLPKYERPGHERIAEAEHTEDVRVVIEALRISASEQIERLLGRLREVPFFLATNAATGLCQRKRAPELYLPLPELKVYFGGNQTIWFLSEIYEPVYQRLEQIGISRTVRIRQRQANNSGYVIIVEQHGHYERGRGGFDPECHIDGLDFALQHPNIERSAYIWNEILAPRRKIIRGYVEQATKANYGEMRQILRVSTVGRLVFERRWLPARNGGWAKPGDLALSDLPSRFQRDEYLATTLEMKHAVEQSYVEQALGFRIDPGDVDFLKQHWLEIQKLKYKLEQQAQGVTTVGSAEENTSFDYAETLREVFRRTQSTDQPEEHVPPGDVRNPEHRRTHIDTSIHQGQSSEPEAFLRFQQVERRVWEKKDNQTREFLARQYGGKCQICQSTFHKRDTTPYFEGLYLVSQIKKRWLDRPGNVLCLCANCCAKFLYGSVEADDILDQIASFRTRREGGMSEATLTVTLCGTSTSIHFTEQHMLELQQLLRAGRPMSKAAD